MEVYNIKFVIGYLPRVTLQNQGPLEEWSAV